MIQITAKAVEAIKRIRVQEGAGDTAKLRIRIVPGGCSGMSYKLEFDQQPSGPGDKSFEKDGVTIITDIKSSLYMKGMELDFRDGLNGSGFVFKNPNAKETCNCGESFST